MLPKSVLAALAWSAVSGNLALAAPSPQRSTLESTSLANLTRASPLNEGAVEKRDGEAPDYCVEATSTIYGGAFSANYADLTPACQRNGDCDFGCLVSRFNSGGADLTEQDMLDLKIALAAQSHKDGYFDTSYKGIWKLSFTTFFGHDLMPPEMLTHYFHWMDYIKLDGSGDVMDLAFEWGLGDKRNVMLASRKSIGTWD